MFETASAFLYGGVVLGSSPFLIIHVPLVSCHLCLPTSVLAVVVDATSNIDAIARMLLSPRLLGAPLNNKVN